jgi:uncharacterized protein (DUF2384 family)
VRAIEACVPETNKLLKEPTVPRATTVRRKAAKTTLTTAQVRRVLYDIGFIVRITRDLEQAVVVDAQRARGLGTTVPTVAA